MNQNAIYSNFFNFTRSVIPSRGNNLHSREREVFIILYFLSNYQFRISEVLRISLQDLLPNFKIMIKLSKSKNYELIRDVELWSLIKEYFEEYKIQCFYTTYKQIVTYMKRYCGNLIIRKKNKSRKITHSFRYSEARALRNLGIPAEVIKRALHHDSIESQKYYYDKK